MDSLISISSLNDFIFCPLSIYFHKLYGNMSDLLLKGEYQISGTAVHNSIDEDTYSTRKDVICNKEIYCEKYGLIGKIDIIDGKNKMLIERKKKIHKLFDGQIFQIYGQYFAMREMGFNVEKLQIYSISDNKKYGIDMPEENVEMLNKFEKIINEMKTFKIADFKPQNIDKCANCIYEPLCDRSLI